SSTPDAAAPRSARSGGPIARATAPGATQAARRDRTSASDTDSQTQEAVASAQTYASTQGVQQRAAAAAMPAVDYVTTDQFNQFEQQVNTRFSEVDKRIDQIGAA